MFDRPDIAGDVVRAGFRGRKVVVVGDAMLDRYLWGDVSRISPEAPVPVVRIRDRTARPGGAANAALNLARLGCESVLVAVCGEDSAGQQLTALLTEAGVDAQLDSVSGWPTVVKTRIIAGHQQMLRLDQEEQRGIGDAAFDAVCESAVATVATADAVIISDYGKGMVQARLTRPVIDCARDRGIPVLVDPKGLDWERYRGATTVTPNVAELAAVTGVHGGDFEAITAAARSLQEQLDLSFLTFTRGEQGMAWIDGEQVHRVPALARKVFDVSGAGDSVIATLAAALAAEVSTADAMRLANMAGGLAVGKVGTVPVSREELEGEVDRATGAGPTGKVCSEVEAAAVVEDWRAARSQTVFTNGCFDILHAGHVALLQQSRRLGDRLVVGVNVDDSVSRLKGPGRPINSLADRCAVLAGMACVDLVVPFAQDTPLELITLLRPEVLVKGADYTEDEVVGAMEVKRWGGRVELIEILEGRSSTRILDRLSESGRRI